MRNDLKRTESHSTHIAYSANRPFTKLTGNVSDAVTDMLPGYLNLLKNTIFYHNFLKAGSNSI